MLLLSPSGWGRYIDPGYLVFVRGAELIAQPFEAISGTLQGRSFAIGTVGTGFRSGANSTESGFSVAAAGVLSFRTIGEATDNELAWFNRSGERLSALAEPGGYRNPQISPDGSRIAVQQTDQRAGRSDVWVIDVARGVKTRLTLDETNVHNVPLWSPDGASIIVKGTPARGVHRWPAAGGAEEQIFPTSFDPNSYSPDGRYLVYTILDSDTNRDIGVLPLFGERKPFPFVNSSSNETHGQVSPDGKWIAYESDESGPKGTEEIYIQSFPTAGQKIRVSTAGGQQPRWRRDGLELFYLSPDDRLMAVPVQTTPGLKVGAPSPLFETRIVAGRGIGTNANYDVTADGQRFIIASRLGDTDNPPITIVLNWTAALPGR